MSTHTMPHVSTPKPGSEYRFNIGDYALAAVEELGSGWGGDYGHHGGSGLIWGPNVPTLRLALDDVDDLVLYLKDESFPDVHLVTLPDGPPTDAGSLRKIGEFLALLIANQYVN